MYGGHDYNPPPPFFSAPSPFSHEIHTKEQAADAWLKSTAARQRALLKPFKAEMAWLSSSEAKQRSDAAKALAISDLKKRFPRADISKFQVQVEFDPNRKATGRVLFPDGDGSWENPLIEDRKCCSQPLKAALGFKDGFPYQLSPLVQKTPQPVPTVDFSDNTTQSVADLFNKEMKIYVTPTDYFTTKFRKIFTKAKIKVTTAKYARKWIKGPDMGFWQQQLNFALWCATTGCGVSREMLFPNSGLNLLASKFAPSISSTCTTLKEKYYMKWVGFRVSMLYQTTRSLKRKTIRMMLRPINESVRNLVLTQVLSFATHGEKNGGLGTVYIGVTGRGPMATDYHYPDPDLALFDDEQITNRDDPNYKANGISFVRNDQGAEKQLKHFVPNRSSGLTPNRLGRINRSIEAFGYCILGAQANTRSSIIGATGTARNTQTDFLVLFDDAIRKLTVSNGPAKYQEAIEKTKVRLNFAIARGVLLLPSQMIINKESVVGYNNNLRRTTDDMKLGVNNHVNQGTKGSPIKHMAGGGSKINPPNSQPSNPIHKKATEAQGIAKKKPTQKQTQTQETDTPATQTQMQASVTDTSTASDDTHHINKALVGLGALALVGLFIWASR